MVKFVKKGEKAILINHIGVMILSLLFLWGELGQAKEPSWQRFVRPNSFKALWVDIYGKVSSVGYPFQAKWIMKTENAFKHPVLKTQFQFPAGSKVQIDHPNTLQGQPNGTLNMTVDIEFIPDTLVINIQKPDGKKETVNFLVLPDSNEPLWIIHPSCPQYLVNIKGVALGARPAYSFLAAYCVEHRSHVRLYLSHSSKVQVTAQAGVKPVDAGPTWSSFDVGKLKVIPPELPLKPEVVVTLTEDNTPLAVHQAFCMAAMPGPDFSFGLGVGITRISYQQSGIQSLYEWALSVKTNVEYRFSKRFDIGGNLFYNPLVLSSSQAVSIQFLGANGRLGLTVTSPESVLQLRLMAGIYYSTSYPSARTLGYQNVMGPQFFPLLRWLLPKNQTAFIYVKYSPIYSGSSFLALNNAETAFGAGYLFPPFKGAGRISLSLDFAFLSLHLPGGDVEADTITLGANYAFF